MIHITQLNKEVKEITYWRNPTKDEIKFGHGATHYRDFDIKICFDEEGFLKLKVRAIDDKHIYHYSGNEYHTTSKAKLGKLVVL
jgi:hypothetical protein